MQKIIDRMKNRSGQSLVEAIIALGILTTGLLGMLTLLTQSYYLNRVASADTQATYLASEGVEIAKNLIDHDVYCWLDSAKTCPAPYTSPGWGTTCFGLIGINGSQDYELDYSTTGCPTIFANRKLSFNTGTHLYSYAGGGQATSFVRKIRVSRPSADEIEVQSIVTWNVGLITQQSIDLDDHFYNWRF